MKVWDECPYKHKLIYKDNVKEFIGNEYTAFGSAIHDVCEKKLLKEDINETELFQLGFAKRIQQLVEKNIEFNAANVQQMKTAGRAILAEVEDALQDYFGDYEVFSSEEMLCVCKS